MGLYRSPRSSVAIEAGIWSTGDFVDAVSDQANSLLYDGDGDASSDWSEGASSPCTENIATPVSNAINVRIFPVPAVDILNVAFDKEEVSMLDIEVIDSYGRIVKRTKASSNHLMKFDLTDLSAGIYYIRASSSGILTTKKFVVLERR